MRSVNKNHIPFTFLSAVLLQACSGNVDQPNLKETAKEHKATEKVSSNISNLLKACSEGDIHALITFFPDEIEPIRRSIEKLPSVVQESELERILSVKASDMEVSAANKHNSGHNHPANALTFMRFSPEWEIVETRKEIKRVSINGVDPPFFDAEREIVTYFVKLTYPDPSFAPVWGVDGRAGPLSEAIVEVVTVGKDGGILEVNGVPATFKIPESQAPLILAVRFTRKGTYGDPAPYLLQLVSSGKVSPTNYRLYFDGKLQQLQLAEKNRGQQTPASVYEDGSTYSSLVTTERYLNDPKIIKFEIVDDSSNSLDYFIFPEFDSFLYEQGYTRHQLSYGYSTTVDSLIREKLGRNWPTKYFPALTPYSKASRPTEGSESKSLWKPEIEDQLKNL